MIKLLARLVIISLKVLFFAALVGCIFCCLNKFKQQYPVVKLKILGELGYIEVKEIESLLDVDGLLLNNLWYLNLNIIKDRLMLNEWIDRLIIKKKWPNMLEISIISHKPIAIWNDNFFLTSSGKVLPSAKQKLKLDNVNLPKFYGKLGKEHLLLSTYFLLLQKTSSIGLIIKTLKFDPEQGIIVWLEQNIILKLGTFDLSERITRFIIAYKKKLHFSIKDICYIDLRYNNGLAVGWAVK